ncbi:MBL fold metallo-hydrolase [Alginatibacterium sediminis]|uniref:MBL fold metallo-hydrolase n=1 Tax=Alginatibacterium sediminis TaxID=2164068 RepID=A0A420EGB4_9ALTE|nr:alkyl sulfatase dimerization domain-containing protein [Alginatibacterium sediminis]RKF19718.1 MBL fold metallo-hydrolase [Alginatibacterium sediminis]
MKKTIIASSIILLLTTPAFASNHSHAHGDHEGMTLDYQGKPASVHTKRLNDELDARLPHEDRGGFENAEVGLIAAFDRDIFLGGENHDDHDHVVWDLAQYEFLNGERPDSVNPSQWRQAQHNLRQAGIYQVTDGFYQIRGLDLAHLSVIESDTGYILYDVQTTREATEHALEQFFKHMPKKPIKAVIYSHSHADHFGGVKGAVSQEDVDAGLVDVIAPRNFMEYAISENIMAGTAMARRKVPQYGEGIRAGDQGPVTAAIGKGISNGELTLIAPTITATEDLHEMVIDGVRMIHLNADNAEAPSGMMTYFPDQKVLWGGEIVVDGMHNIYTLRGAEVRDALAWSKYINIAINEFSDAEFLFASHGAPKFGNAAILEYMKLQRDNYGFVHNQALRLANHGVDIHAVGDMLADIVPEVQFNTWETNGYHGSYSHNAKAVVNKYLGYYNANPATLDTLPLEKSATTWVEAMGGMDTAYNFMQQQVEAGNYRFAVEMGNKMVYAEPSNQKVANLQADALEQLGYQAESSGWRNSYLVAATELRENRIILGTKAASQDAINGMTTSLMLDYAGVRLNAPAAEGVSFTMNLIVPDEDAIHFVELANSNLNNIIIEQATEADLSLTINRADINQIMMKQTTLDELFESKQASFDGNIEGLVQLQSMLDNFDEAFELMRPHPMVK